MLRLALPMLLAATIAAPAVAETPAPPPPAAPAAAPTAPFVRPPAPGRLVDIGGRRLHLLCKGDAAGPSVIFEAGLSQFAAVTTYGKAQDLIAPFARVCTYDRAGLGWSDPAPEGRTQQDMADDLHKLLVSAKVPGPYVLVGHSMGGLISRLYVKTYPKDVVGVVLADASSEISNFTPDAPAERAKIVAEIDAGLKTAKPGQPLIPLPAGTAPEVIMAFTPEIVRGVREEYMALERVPVAMQAPGGYGGLGSRPLVVLRRGKVAQPDTPFETSWRGAQEQLPALSTNSVLIVAANAGHVIPYDDPAIVADAVRQVLTAVRSRTRVAANSVTAH